MSRPYITADEKSQFEQEGFAIIRSVFTPSEVEVFREEQISVWLEQLKHGKIVQSAHQPLRSLFPPIRNGHESNERLKRLMLDHRIFALAEQMLDEEALVVGSTCFFKSPGSDKLPMHQDNYDIGASPGTSCAVWISVDRSDRKNGGMMFVPGTHRLGLLKPKIPGHNSIYGQTVPIPEGYPTLYSETEPGDVLLFNGDVLHGSGANENRYDFRFSFVVHLVGISIEKVYVQHNRLLDKEGKTVTRRLNKSHSINRLFLDK